MTIADFIAPGRCPCCGNARTTWTADNIVAAAQRWTEANGTTPRTHDWRRAGVGHPSEAIVRRVFRSWNDMLLAAGLPVRKAGGGRSQWTKDAIAAVMLDHLLRVGKWPTSGEWHTSSAGTGRPAQATVVRLFGSWNAAKRYAGWDGTAGGGLVVEAKCVECGTDLENVVIGCKTCADRARTRMRRAERLSIAAPAAVGGSIEPSEKRLSPRGGNPFVSTSDREPDVAAVERRAA